ncbi:LptA/OstA family protein [Hellea balneolensis]|uniref:LptA/OstA family protein n=1 Tax=Hellea balneolensis TaxID=287478 RepID=UPI000404E2C7|nr:LptA/OstA family protein [Hellea balneolensis]
MRLTGFALIALLSLSVSSLSAHAQIFGGDAPINVLAEKATYEGGLTVLVGNVDVTQGIARIQSDTMNIYRSEAEPDSAGSLKLGAVNRIDARGNFRYTTPDNNVTGDRGVYERDKGIITVTGNVKVRQPGGNTASTDKLIYNVNTETIRFSGQCQGSDCSGRPTIRIGN